jgi:dTDP-glucose 4,6-dehydratase/UDP-glucuronate decarboxylase
MNKYIKKICEDIFEYGNQTDFIDKTILITGANGLIGGMIADFFYFLKDKKKININLILTSKSESDKAYRLKDIISDKSVRYISSDLSNYQEWECISNEKIDFCFYCSGYATPFKFINQPINTLSVNTIGLYSTLNFILNNNKNCKVIYMSSAEVYSSNFESKEHKETDKIIFDFKNQRNFYKLSKISGELIVNNYIEKGLNVISIRVSTCFGPGILDDDNRVLSDLVRKGLNNDCIELLDDGKASRKYLNISDFCKMIFNIVKSGKNNVYNISGDKEITIYELSEIISKVLNKPIKVGTISNNLTKFAPNKVNLSLELYENEFGVFDFKSTEEGVKDFIEWYINELN